MSYKTIIVEIMSEMKKTFTVSPEIVEAYMRLQYGTLNHLSREEFEKEIILAQGCFELDPEGSQELAQIYG